MTAALRVPRDLIHRASDQEVLVSAPWRTAESTYRNTVVTAGISGYYLDHPVTCRADLLLLTEACRQAAISVLHQFEGLPLDTALFINSIEAEICDVRALVNPRREITITTLTGQMRLRADGSPKKISCTQLGHAGPGRAAIRTVMTVQGVPKQRYPELRAYQRDGSVPPTTAGLRAAWLRRDGLSAPAAVGRTQLANVMLAGLRIQAGQSSAALAPDFANPSLFDHDYDHYPAMVLLEAGRQLALAGTRNPSRRIATRAHAQFLHFAELDRPVTFRARCQGNRTEMECLQNDVAVTRMCFDLEPVGGAA